MIINYTMLEKTAFYLDGKLISDIVKNEHNIKIECIENGKEYKYYIIESGIIDSGDLVIPFSELKSFDEAAKTNRLRYRMVDNFQKLKLYFSFYKTATQKKPVKNFLIED